MIGNRIKELRIMKKLNQQELAKALGVSKSSVAMWEVNKREPVLSMVGEISRYFNVPPAFLLGTGVFSNWEEIAEKKDMIFTLLHSALPNLNISIFEKSDIGLILLVDALFDKVVVNESGGVDVYFIDIFNDAQKNTALAENDKDDANKQKLMNNYDKMNQTGQSSLVQYSDYLAEKPENLKSSPDLDKRDA